MIHQLRIQNFKSLRDVTVNLAPVTVFIGRSGTGKTNFALALRFLRDYLALGPQHLAHQYAGLQCATNRTGAMQFTVTFDVPGFADRFAYTIGFEAEHIQHPLVESLEYGERTVFKQLRSDQRGGRPQWETPPALVSVPEPGDTALGRLSGLEEAVVAYTALTAAVGIYAFPYDVLTTAEQHGAGRSNGVPGLADDGSNYLKVIQEIARNLQDVAVRRAIAASLRQINETVQNVDLDSIQNPRKALVGHRAPEDKTLTLELGQESDGFRRFYAHLLALYQMPSKQTLVFEEPENGIYPGALSLLAEEFRAAPDARRGQILLPHHSPALLDHFADDQIRVVELVGLETQIDPLAEDQRETIKKDLLHTGELLTVDPARRQQQ